MWQGWSSSICQRKALECLERLSFGCRALAYPQTLCSTVSVLDTLSRTLCLLWCLINGNCSCCLYMSSWWTGTVPHRIRHGKAKLVLKPAHSIPRMELCAAVLAVQMAELICQEMDLEFQAVYYTDSKTVLGYILNTSGKFMSMYRVSKIRESTTPTKWIHISIDHNPADFATRPIAACLLQQTNWFISPSFLKRVPTTVVFTSDNKRVWPCWTRARYRIQKKLYGTAFLLQVSF